MANHVSSAKRARQTIKITKRRQHVRSTARTFVKRVRTAIEAGDKTKAAAALKDCVKRLDQAVAKGIWHRRTGSRYISRLSAQVSAMK